MAKYGMWKLKNNANNVSVEKNGRSAQVRIIRHLPLAGLPRNCHSLCRSGSGGNSMKNIKRSRKESERRVCRVREDLPHVKAILQQTRAKKRLDVM